VTIGANLEPMAQEVEELEVISRPRGDGPWRLLGLGLALNIRRKELSQLGIRRSWTSDLPIWILVLLLASAAAVAIVTGHIVGPATAFITVAGLLVAILQWRAGLAEKAVDALYQRIALANQMRLSASEGLTTDDEAAVARERANDYRFYVCTELDSLEYVVLRYRFGLGMSVLIAGRAVNHFRGRCRTSAVFCEEARERVEKGAYLDETKTIVEKIVDAARAGSGGVESQTRSAR
jgi:hypothetical protein